MKAHPFLTMEAVIHTGDTEDWTKTTTTLNKQKKKKRNEETVAQYVWIFDIERSLDQQGVFRSLQVRSGKKPPSWARKQKLQFIHKH